MKHMTSKQPLVFASLLLTAIVLLAVNCTSSNEPAADEMMTAQNGNGTDTSCATAPDNWFPHAQTPDPAEGADSPFGNMQTTTNCDFHLWSWQKFLYLTKPGPGGKALFESLYLIDNEMNRITGNQGGVNLIMKDTTQAGNTHGTLYDRKNNPIYYSIYMNQQMFDFSSKWLDKFAKAGLDSLAKYGYDTITYPVGCLELKASWILASSLNSSDRGNYYITKAHMKTASGPIVEVALLGLHVVGRVANHPEFIWATFDHSMLAPTYDWSNSQGPAQVLSKDNYLFYDAGKTANDCRMNFTTAQQKGFKSVYQVYRLGFVQSADNKIQTAKDRSNNAHIEALNKSVLAQLSKEKGPWMNYVYTGSVWTDPTVTTLKPNDKKMGKLTNPALRGSRALGNVTMETFEQPDAIAAKATGPNNCFLCHTTQDDDSGEGGTPKTGYNLALSHVFTNAFNVRRHPKLKGTIHL
jgi:hypothetical protein